VIESSAGKLRALAYGVVKNPPKLAAHQCLREIHDTLARIAALHQPTTFAIEGVIFVQNVRTAIILGSARGAALLEGALQLSHGHLFNLCARVPRMLRWRTTGRR
jgi:crossover junction endodeoxyribonuclease RuvC